MGFRSTFVTQDRYSAVAWPAWFREKWQKMVYFPEGFGPISSTLEAKTYEDVRGSWWDIEADIHKVLVESHFFDDRGVEVSFKLRPFVMIWLHECGGVTRVEFDESGPVYTEPSYWRASNGQTHYYCHGCSDARFAETLDDK